MAANLNLLINQNGDETINGTTTTTTTYYSVTVNTYTGGTITVRQPSSTIYQSSIGSITSGNTIYVKATANDKYTLSSWYAKRTDTEQTIYTCTSATGSFTMPAADVKIYATFTKDEYDDIITNITSYNISVSSPANGNIYIGTDSSNITYTTLNVTTLNNVYVKCVPNTGYLLDSWTVSGNSSGKNMTSSTGGYIYNIQGDVVVSATFSQYNQEEEEEEEEETATVKYSVIFNANGGKTSSGSLGFWMPNLSSLTLPEAYNPVGLAEKSGYVFLGWYSSVSSGVQVYDESGNGTNNTPYWSSGVWQKTDEDTTLYAHWRSDKYTIKFNGNDPSEGTMSDLTCTYNTNVTLPLCAFKKVKKVFSGWGLSSTGTVKYSNGETVKNITGESSITLYAIWIDEPSKGRDTGLQNDYNKMSAYNIKNSINGDNTEYKGTSSDYKIKVTDPDSVDTYDIFEPYAISDGNNKYVISSVDVKLKSDSNNISIKTINRYSGYYNPIFKDILFYDDYDGYNYSNTSFDYDYKDGQGSFGVINNIWFHKINDKSKNIITTLEPYYPLTGQYALDNKDYNIFSTSLDMGYFTRQDDIDNKSECDNTASMTEKLCMMGSRYLNVPEEIEIEGFIDGGEWNDEWVGSPELCSGEVMYKEVNDSNVNYYFFLKKRIIRYFSEMLKEEFETYIDKNYSYGIYGLDDDIEEYVKKNVLKLYELKRIRTFVKRTKKGINNSKIENIYDTYLGKNVTEMKAAGLKEILNVSMTKIGTDNFDRKLVYNLRTGEQEEFGFSFIIKKI